MKVEENVPLAPLTTFGIGGVARFFARAQSEGEVLEALEFAREHELPTFILGGGSNIVVADDGFPGLVLRVDIGGISFKNKEEKTFVTAGAGVVWDELVKDTVAKELEGLECMSGVPGTVGGAVVANLGAYGAQVSDMFVSADVIDRENIMDGIKMLSKDECNFSYHQSVFNHTRDRYIVLSATFALLPNTSPQISYEDHRYNLAAMVSGKGGKVTLTDVREGILTVREEKGALYMEGRKSYKSAGSFFSTLYITAERHAHILDRASALNSTLEQRLRPWAWAQADGSYKIAAGFLLEFTEFSKGFVRGTVGVSPDHQLFLINRGGASARELVSLARDMEASVEKLFGVRLQREVEFVGDVEHSA